jgi:hypothetical protein
MNAKLETLKIVIKNQEITMKTLLCILGCVLIISLSMPSSAKSSSGGSHNVKGHVKKDGTYVAPHSATNPNQTQRDNWSSKPQVNPYTGKEGTKEPQR